MKYYKIKEIIQSNDSNYKKSIDIFSSLLKTQQREIFNNIPKGALNAITALEINKKTGISTKNISSQINQLRTNFPIGVKTEENGCNKYYKKK